MATKSQESTKQNVGVMNGPLKFLLSALNFTFARFARKIWTNARLFMLAFLSGLLEIL